MNSRAARRPCGTWRASRRAGSAVRLLAPRLRRDRHWRLARCHWRRSHLRHRDRARARIRAEPAADRDCGLGCGRGRGAASRNAGPRGAARCGFGRVVRGTGRCAGHLQPPGARWGCRRLRRRSPGRIRAPMRNHPRRTMELQNRRARRFPGWDRLSERRWIRGCDGVRGDHASWLLPFWRTAATPRKSSSGAAG